MRSFSEKSGEQTFEVGALRVNVGRKDSNHVRFDDSLCSSTHCRLWVESGKLWIEDLESKNGTYVNGSRVRRAKIYVSDKISVGDSTMHISTKLNSQDTLNKLAPPPGQSTNRQELSLQSSSGYDLIRSNPLTAIKDPRLLKRMAHQGATHLQPEEMPPLPDTRWQQAWRHWLAMCIDLAALSVIFCIPFVAMLFWKVYEGPGAAGDLVNSTRLAGAVLASIVLGWYFWAINTRNLGGTIGQRLTGLASVHPDDRSR